MEKRTIAVIVINVVVFILTGVIALLFLKLGKPYTQGFYCDDTSISKPYRSSTVPIASLFIAALALALVCFTLVLCKRKKEEENSKGKSLERTDYKLISRDVLYLFVFFIYGSALNMFITDVGKYSIGRLRPHFITVCQPNWQKINCTTDGRKNLIFGDAVCKTTNLKSLREARLSFPSGHAAFAGYASTFLILFLETQSSYSKLSVVPKLFSQILIGAAGFYVGLSRVTDYFHHPTDVLTGFLLGILIATCIHLSLVRYYYEKPPLRRQYKNKVSDETEFVEVENSPIN